MAGDLSHLDDRGRARMVDVSKKPETERRAVAYARLEMAEATLARIEANDLAKGDVVQAARIAGILAAKRTPELIPLCHPIPIAEVAIDIAREGVGRLGITAEVRATARTGVEMEALAAAAVAALTVYDMVKAVDRAMRVSELKLLRKEGGKSGVFEQAKG